MAGFVLPPDDYSGMGALIADSSSVTRDQQLNTARSSVGGNYSFATTAAGTVGFGATLDLVDVVSSSIGLSERGQLSDRALQAIGSPGLARFYNENRSAIEVGSGVAGIIAADMAAKRFLAPASATMRVLSRSRVGSTIATLDQRYERSLRAVQAMEQNAARRGVIGAEQYVGDVVMTNLGRAPTTANLAQARRGVRWNAIARGGARNVTTEALLVATQNQNSFLFSEDTSENILWMSAGLGLGAFIDRTMSIYAMRKSANGDVSRRLFSRAYDPSGTEGDRLRASLMEEGGDNDLSHLGYLQGHYTDRATSYAISARTLANRELTDLGDLAGRRERLGTQQIALARDEMQKATVRGINGIPNTGFSMNTPGLGNHLDMRLMDDPSSMYGIEAIGAAPPTRTLSDIHETRVSNITARQEALRTILREGGEWRTKTVRENGKKVSKRILVPLSEKRAEALRTEMRQLFFHQSLTPQVSTGREWVPMQIGKLLENFEEPKIRKTRSDERTVWELEGTELDKAIGFSNDGELFLPRGKAIDNLDFYDHLRLYRVGQTAMDAMVKAQEGMILPKKPNWFQLDFAEELIRRTGDEGLIQFPAGMTRQTAQVESFKQKVKAIHKNKANLEDPDTVAKLRMQYNLPALTSYESGLLTTSEHPIEVLLRNATGKKIDDLTYTELVTGIREVRKINGLQAEAKDKVEGLAGDMFKFMVDNQGRPIQPILGYRRPLAPFDWSKEDLAERLAMRKSLVRDKLIDKESGEITSTLTRTLLDEPDFITSAQVQGLQDSQLQSMLPGFATAAPQTARGNFLQSVVSREWRDRDNPILLAAARIRDKGERIVRAFMQARVEKALGDVVTRVNGPRNLQSRLLLNQYFSFRPGWDLKKELKQITLPNGQTAFEFELDPKSVLNQRRWKSQYGEEMPEGAAMRTPQGKPMVVDELGREFLQRFNTLTDDYMKEKNSILRATGLGKINHQAHYAPPPNMKGKYIGFTLDAERNPVPGGTIIASTPEEFSRMKSRLEGDPNSPLNRNGNVFYTQDELKDFATIWDRAQMNFIDPGTTAVQPGKRSEGKSIGWEFNPNAIEDALTTVRDSYLQHGDDVMRILFNDQIHAAEVRAQIARTVDKNKAGKDSSKQRSIYDHYVNNITGRLGVTTQASFVGRQYRSWEEKINKLLAETSPHVSNVWRATREWIDNATPGRQDKTAVETFNRLTEAMGPYMPFKSAAELVERQNGAKRPPELAEITGNLSRFEAAMRLRMLEIIHPVMNLSGIVNAIPSVIRHYQPMKGESVEDFARRIGHSAQIFNLGDRTIAVPDMAKIGHRAFQRAWSRKAHPDYEYMQSHGFITQEVAEFQRQFGAIDSRGKWKSFMVGSTVPQNRFQEKGLIGHISTLSDRSEDFSRSWGHMVGLELADTLGIKGREARHSFAHDIANKMIANYDPKNRPEIFQGALGAPIGLFQSFIWNYYQRLFRYIETGDARSFATQYAMQGSLFGVTTLPGWSAVNKLFFDHSDGENSPYDAIFQRFGQETGDVLMGGVLSNLPKLANILPGEQGIEGIDLYSRGDTNIRLPVVNPPPVIDTAKRVWNAIGQAIGAFSSRNPNLTDNQLAEITSNMLTNRPMAGFIEQAFADGYDTDRFGQVASEANGAMESIYRVMGVRSLRQAKEQEAFYANRNAQEQQNALMTDLRLSVRAALRAGEYDSIPRYYEQYVQNGGDPTRFRRWIRDSFEAATKSRAERQLEDILDDENKMAMIERLLDAEVMVDETELNPDYYQIEAPENDLNPDMPEGLFDPRMVDQNMDQFQNDDLTPARF